MTAGSIDATVNGRGSWADRSWGRWNGALYRQGRQRIQSSVPRSPAAFRDGFAHSCPFAGTGIQSDRPSTENDGTANFIFDL